MSCSDGEGKGGIGFAIWSNQLEIPLAAYTQAPIQVRHLWKLNENFDPDEEGTDIFEIEAVAPLLILRNWSKHLQDAMWVHYIDNNGALGALVKGSSSVLRWSKTKLYV